MEEKGPVTISVRHRVKPGSEPAFEDWLRGISQAALQFEGHLGFDVIRPSDGRRPEYLVLFRFDTLDHFEAWEGSEVRRQWLERAESLIVQPPVRERRTGMEIWFSPPSGCVQPPRHKMVVVTLLTIYPLILAVQALMVPHLEEWPVVLRTLFTSALLVLVMTYAAMPVTTRVFSRWLYKQEM